MESSEEDIRWIQSLDSLIRAEKRLSEGRKRYALYGGFPDDLMEEGLIQRYEYTFELSWKTLKRFLEYKNVKNLKGAESVFTASIEHGILQGPLYKWVKALEARNTLSHQYSEDESKKLATYIVYTGGLLMTELKDELLKRKQEHEKY